MSREARLNMSGVLLAAGYDAIISMSMLRIPLPKSVRCSAQASDTHVVELYIYDENKKLVEKPALTTSQTYELSSPILPMVSEIVSAVEHDHSGDWSIDRSLLQVHFTDETSRVVYFGDAKSGPAGDPSPAHTHRVSIPMPPGWPEPGFLKADYPPPA